MHGTKSTSKKMILFPDGIKKGNLLKATETLDDLGVLIGVKVSFCLLF